MPLYNKNVMYLLFDMFMFYLKLNSQIVLNYIFHKGDNLLIIKIKFHIIHMIIINLTAS